MKILHTISGMSLSSGGPTSCLWNLVKGLQLEDLDIDVLTYAVNTKDKLISDDPLIKTIASPRFSRYGYSGKYREALENFKQYDIVHANALWQYTTHAAAVFAVKNNIPLIISTHGMLYPEALKKSKYIKEISMLLYQKADIRKATVLHATCIQEMEYIRALGYINPIVVIPNAIEVSSIKVLKIRNNEIKRVGFIGRFVPIKNIENLIKAWSKTGKNKSDWELVLIGDGSIDYKQSLVNLAKNLEIKNITFPGFLTGAVKEEMLDSLSYLVLPSKSENFGMVVPEALIREIPVIASKGTPWEELNTCNAGWWIDIGVQPLANALQEALQLPEEQRLLMGQNGRKLVKEKYSIEAVASQMIKLYKWILNRGEKPEFVY